MVDIEEFISTFPFIGTILILIALFTPAAGYSYSTMGVYQVFSYTWMFGLQYSYYIGYAPRIFFSGSPLILLPSIICTVIIFVASILMLISIFKIWKGNKNIEDFEIFWLILAIINIITTIFWMIAMELAYFLLSIRKFGFWGSYFPGFGVIGVFLGASFILFGIFMKRRVIK